MKISFKEISNQTLTDLLKTLDKAKLAGTYLKSIERKYYSPNWFIISGFIIYIIVLLLTNLWALEYYLLISGTLLSYLLIREFQTYYISKKLGDDSVFFDLVSFFFISEKEVQVIPLTEFQYTDILLSPNGYHYLVRFFFKNVSVTLPRRLKEEPVVNKFQNFLETYCKKYIQADTANNHYYEDRIKSSSKISLRIKPLLISIVVFIMLWLLLPIILDNNQYRTASNLDTASAYRTYLADSRNIRYRETARTEIMNLYNFYLSKYKQSTYHSEGSTAFIMLLEYLRDKNIYNVNMNFYPTSRLVDLEADEGFNIIPITQSFTKEKNEARKNQVVNTIKSSLGKIFPTDILTIISESSSEVPNLEVHYYYWNNPESRYYPVKEENLPESDRTWYYGIEVEWYFKILIPDRQKSVYEFDFISRPAEEFDSKTYSTDIVYSSMALSAFKDFEKEFQNQFLDFTNIE